MIAVIIPAHRIFCSFSVSHFVDLLHSQATSAELQTILKQSVCFICNVSVYKLQSGETTYVRRRKKMSDRRRQCKHEAIMNQQPIYLPKPPPYTIVQIIINSKVNIYLKDYLVCIHANLLVM